MKFFIALILSFSFISQDVYSQNDRKVKIVYPSSYYEGNKVVNKTKTFEIFKDSIKIEVILDGKTTTKIIDRKNDLAFAADIYAIDESHWNYFQEQSKAENCDFMKDIQVTLMANSKTSSYNIRNTGNCFPQTIKTFMEKMYAFMKEN